MLHCSSDGKNNGPPKEDFFVSVRAGFKKYTTQYATSGLGERSAPTFASRPIEQPQPYDYFRILRTRNQMVMIAGAIVG